METKIHLYGELIGREAMLQICIADCSNAVIYLQCPLGAVH